MDNLFEQMTQISKAHAYDIMRQKADELETENERLRARVKYLEDLILEYTTKIKANLSGPKVDQFLKDQLTPDSDDLKDINI